MNIGILVLGRRRPGFDPEWGEHVLSRLDCALAAVPFGVFRPAPRIVDDATLAAACEECRNAAVDAVVVLQPTMSDGNLAPLLAQQWPDRIVLWATPEKPTGAMISSCSLVGAHTFASTLRQLGVGFELVYGMPGEPDVAADLLRAVRVVSALPRLRRSRVGLVGYHAPGFIDMAADPFELRRQLGVSLRHTGLREFQDAIEGFDAGTVAADVAAVRALGLPLDGVDESDLATASRCYLALKTMVAELGLDALAVRCWPELPNVVGQWPYLAFVRLATEGFSIACEGDVDGALSCLVAGLLGCGQSYLSDWLEHDRDTVTLWHAGSAPLGLCEPVGSPGGPRISRHFNNRKPAVVEANLRGDMPVTVFRLWRCDGRYRLAAFEARTVPPRRHLMGTNGLARVEGTDVRRLFETLCYEGMPHHVVVVEGLHRDTLERFARLAGIAVVRAS
ncbi:MAG: L-fucose/L-arabinose isomerase family protein [Lentisphaeria bacterium]|nr:L-fucose/L-arabinose isomerase family protein [Lentisphaeria bacterium]